MNEVPAVMTIGQVASYLNVTADWVYDHAKQFPGFKLGNRWRFRKEAIDAWILTKEQAATK